MVVCAGLVVPSRPSQAAGALDTAAAALRHDPVFVDPAAERKITDGEAAQLRDQIIARGNAMFVALVPESAIAEAGNVDALPSSLYQRTGLAGTYAVVANKSFRAASSSSDSGRDAALATASFQAKRDAGTFAVLSDFVDRVAASRAASPAPAAQPGQPGQPGQPPSAVRFPTRQPVDSTPSSPVGSLLPFLLLGVAVVVVVAMMRSVRRPRFNPADLQAERNLLQAELSVLAQDVTELEPEVTLHPDARDDYDAGVTRFRAAEAAIDSAGSSADLSRVRRVVAEAQWAMARARAHIDGREPPPPPADLQVAGARGEPSVAVERDVPTYVGHPGPFHGGGWFSGGGGFLGGILLGEALGGSRRRRGWGGGWGSGWSGGGSSGGGGWTGGGSGGAGGGDWGGGGSSGGSSGGGSSGGGSSGGGGGSGGGDW
jgi:hypothetical protein